MKKHFATALSAIALSWVGGAAVAQQPAASTPATLPPPHAAPSGAVMVRPDWTPACGGGWAQEDCNHRGGGITASAGVLILKPSWDTNPAYSSAVSVGLTGDRLQGSTTNEVIEFSQEYRVAPRFEVGFSGGDGLGARVRFFAGKWSSGTSAVDQLNKQQGVEADPLTGRITSANPLALGISSNGSAEFPSFLNFNSNLHMNVWDFEATKRAEVSRINLLLSAGVRYAHISENYDAFEVLPAQPSDPFGDPPVFPNLPTSQTLISGHNLNGFGPTLAVEGHMGVGGGLGVYSAARGSLLYSQNKQRASLLTTYDPDAVFAQGNEPFLENSTSWDSMIPIIEIEVGAEWAREMGNAELYLQSALVGQMYSGVGNQGRNGQLTQQSNDSLYLYGVSLIAGIRY